MLQRGSVIATSSGFLVLMSDGCIEPITKPAFCPLLITWQCTQKIRVEHARVDSQAAGRIVSASGALARMKVACPWPGNREPIFSVGMPTSAMRSPDR